MVSSQALQCEELQCLDIAATVYSIQHNFERHDGVLGLRRLWQLEAVLVLSSPSLTITMVHSGPQKQVSRKEAGFRDHHHAVVAGPCKAARDAS